MLQIYAKHYVIVKVVKAFLKFINLCQHVIRLTKIEQLNTGLAGLDLDYLDL